MSCPKATTTGERTRAVLAGLFARRPAAAAAHRLMICCRASRCGRLCERLVKAPGLQAWCVDLRAGRRTDLYAALADPAFRCPEGRF